MVAPADDSAILKLVGRVGFEPTASRLKGESTSAGGSDPRTWCRRLESNQPDLA